MLQAPPDLAVGPSPITGLGRPDAGPVRDSWPAIRASAAAAACPGGGTEPGESLRSPQALVGVLDQQIADGDTPPVGLDGEPLGQFDRNDEAAPDIIVALPGVLVRLRQTASPYLGAACCRGSRGVSAT
jgi:hypothetical protein